MSRIDEKSGDVGTRGSERWRHGLGGRSGIALFAFALVTAAGCAGSGAQEEEPTDDSEVAREYAPQLDVDLSEMERRPGGLYVHDLREGSGELAEAGDMVRIHYTGWLPSGEKFDSSRDRGTPLVIPVGIGRVIDGWDQGVPGMRVGGQRRLVIPPAMAYGDEGAGNGVIPPGATLVFDLELVGIEEGGQDL